MMLNLVCVFVCVIGQNDSADLPKPVKDAQKKLEKVPSDEMAHLVLAKFYIENNEWEKARPHLITCGDKALKKAAEEESENQVGVDQLSQIGKAWMEAASKHKKLRRQIYDHIAICYSKTWPTLDETSKSKFREQGKRLSAPFVISPERKGPVSSWIPDWHPKDFPQRPFLDNQFAHSGSYSVCLPTVPDENTSNSFISFATDVIPAFGGEVEASAWVRSEGTISGQDHIEVKFFNSIGRHFHSEHIGLIPVDIPFWVKLSRKIQIPPDSVCIQLQSIVFSDKGTVWLDDLSMSIDGKSIVKNGDFEISR